MLELLVVIVLIGVLAAISPPCFSMASAPPSIARWHAALQTLRFTRAAVAVAPTSASNSTCRDRTFQLPGGKRKGKWPENIAPELTHGR